MESNLKNEKEVVLDYQYVDIKEPSVMFTCERNDIENQGKSLYSSENSFQDGINECGDSYRGYPIETFEDGDPSLLFNNNQSTEGRISDFPVKMNDVVYEHFHTSPLNGFRGFDFSMGAQGVESDRDHGSDCNNWRDRSRPKTNFDIFNNKRKYGFQNNDHHRQSRSDDESQQELPNIRFKNRFNHESPSRFNPNSWRDSKMAAKHLKFCPGENCRVYMPLYSFGSNCNMSDGLDVYCLECNNRKRLEKQKWRSWVNTIALSKTKIKACENRDDGEGDEKPFTVTDKFEEYLKEFNIKNKKEEKTEETKEEYDKRCKEAKMREVEKVIYAAAFDAEKRFKIKIKQLDVTEICRKLFMGGRFICEFTNNPVTPQCLLDHHSITFEFRPGRDGSSGESLRKMDIVCSDSRLSIRKPKHWT